MWAPELHVAASVLGIDPVECQVRQIGTTIVHDNKPAAPDISALPAFIRRALKAIREDDTAKASASYYYPFFANYALTLACALKNCACSLRRGGTLVVFVRDATRKDILLEVGRMVEVVLRESGLSIAAKDVRVVRHHLGMLRKGAPAGIYGLAQREWWLALRRGVIIV